jgi:hypothetical protein
MKKMLERKADKMAVVMGTDFKCASGWLHKFKTETEF